MHRATRSLVLIASGSLASTALGGPDWTELGDAGSVIQFAQAPLGNGPINSIAGELTGFRGGTADLEDLYLIGITEPTSFELVLEDPQFDAQLFLFNITLAGEALGLLANDDANEKTTAPMLTSMATDGTMAMIQSPGDYLIAVAGKGRQPISATGEIFSFDSSTEVSGADGPGGFNAHIGWTGDGQIGRYRVEMESTEFPEIPAAPALAPLVLAGLMRRRSR